MGHPTLAAEQHLHSMQPQTKNSIRTHPQTTSNIQRSTQQKLLKHSSTHATRGHQHSEVEEDADRRLDEREAVHVSTPSPPKRKLLRETKK
mmetsp:Transcript_1299/g.2764  ORF Transcript_1299/g.2764 Transcript_1299/m.2764 type:complete len:91 (-) Transcript_1299:241-513(-)|eukprot:CAMPEP_0183339734 /NCGR_PEP_ID=MMETSP0164_2-20130417/6556_1 /TAXON_ID=221442 /ORGANISM="Coccolithus pelagicus ssp braarudi, Strain PLY182g" /LENGTH=90 /DNA_ID=CAMNT_0025509787 /DNA_START=56 /DNA_END=328 /DNA_ORIENTATION=+